MLVNPEDWFSPFNVRVHGITEDAVVGAPTFAAIEAVVREHLHQAFGAYDLEPPSTVWLDSARVAGSYTELRTSLGLSRLQKYC